MVAIWPGALLVLVYAEVIVTQDHASLALTALETATVELENYFQGDALTFEVSSTSFASVQVTNSTVINETHFPIPEAVPTSPQIHPTFYFFGSFYLLTYTNTTLYLYRKFDHSWALHWEKKIGLVIESVALMKPKEYEIYVFVATRNETQTGIWTFSCTDLEEEPRLYTGFELFNLTNLTLHSSLTFNGLTLALKGTRLNSDLIFLYEFSSRLLTLFERIDHHLSGETLHIKDFQIACYLVVLDELKGLVYFEYDGFNMSEYRLGSLPETRSLSLSNIHSIPNQNDYLVLWTSSGAFYGPVTNLPLLGFFPLPEDMNPMNVSMVLSDKDLILVGQGNTGTRLMVVQFSENGKASAILSHILSDSNLSFGCQLVSQSLEFIQVQNSLLRSLSVTFRTPKLHLSHVTSDFQLNLTAFSGLGGSGSLSLNITSVPLTDNHIYYGSGFQLTKNPPESIEFKESFFQQFAEFNISLDGLFAGPALQYSIQSHNLEPNATQAVVLEVTQRVSIIANASNQFTSNAVPMLGCRVTGASMVSVIFTGNIVVLVRFDGNDVQVNTMRSFEIENTPKLCVASEEYVWVFAQSENVTSVYQLGITIWPLSIQLEVRMDTNETCQTLKMTEEYFMCVGVSQLLIVRLNDKSVATIGASHFPRSINPWKLTDAEFLGNNSDLIAISDQSNGLNQFDITDAFLGSFRLNYDARLLPASDTGRQLHYSNNKLVVVGGVYLYSVYHYTGQSLEFLMALQPQCAKISHTALVADLLFTGQCDQLVIYNIATSVHNSLYALLEFDPYSNFLLFPYGDQVNIMVVSILDVREYRTKLYEVLVPSSPASFSCLLWCFNCMVGFKQVDIVLTVSIVAVNSLGGYATRDIRVVFLNQGTFVDYAGNVSNYTTLPASNSTDLELMEVFQGNHMLFTMTVNNKTGWSDKPSAVEMTSTHVAHQVTGDGTQCPFLSHSGYVFFLCDEILYVYSLSNATLQWDTTINISFLNSDLQLSSILHPDSNTTLLLLSLDTSSLVALVYNHTLRDIITWKTLTLSKPCLSLSPAHLTSGHYRLICSSSLDDNHYTSGTMLTILELVWTQGALAAFNLLDILNPLNLNITPFRPYSFDVSPLNTTTFALFFLDQITGINMISVSISYNLVTQISPSDLSLLINNESILDLVVCGDRLVVVSTSHILVYVIYPTHLEWAGIIYPFNEDGFVTYVQDTALCYKGEETRFLAVLADSSAYNSTSFVRIIDFKSANSHVVTEFQSFYMSDYHVAGFLWTNLLLIGFPNGEIDSTLHEISTPLLLFPSLTSTEFNSLYNSWGTTIFEVEIAAGNAQSTVISPVLTFRRLMYSRLERSMQVDEVSPWVLALYVVFLVMLGMVGVVVLRRQAKEQEIHEDVSEDLELRPVND